MGKAKRGQTVRHNKTGEVGVVQSVVRGTVRVIFRDGSSATGQASQYSKASGCLVILAIPAVVLVIGVIGFGYSQAA